MCVISVDLLKGGGRGQDGKYIHEQLDERGTVTQCADSQSRLSSSVHDADWICVITKAGRDFIDH